MRTRLQELASVPVREVHQREPVRVGEDDVLIDVVTMLRERGRGSAVVQDQAGKLVGIFTERDLMVRVTHADHDWHRTPVRDVMTAQPTCVADTDSLSTALRLMHDGGFRHLPRVGADGRPTGILSVRDILAFIAAHFPREFLNLPPDPSREAKEPWGG